MKRGFTLVELSIVLVIIGLLIGGILAAQSMIETARVQSVVRKVQQIDITINNFKTKFNGLPGDSSSFGCIVYGDTNICNDQIITQADGPFGVNGQDPADGEIGHFWPDLQAGGFTDSGKTFVVHGPNEGFAIHEATAKAPYVKATLDTALVVMQCRGIGNPVAKNCYTFWTDDGKHPALSPVFALAVDTKLDDGIADAGRMRNDEDYLDPGGTDDNLCNGPDPGAAKYLVENSGAHCYGQIQILNGME